MSIRDKDPPIKNNYRNGNEVLMKNRKTNGKAKEKEAPMTKDPDKTKKKKLSAAEKQRMIEKLTVEMKNAAKLLEFEHAAYLRDKIKELQES